MRVPVWQLGPVTIWSPALEAATTAVTGGDELTIDEIPDCLETNRQRATYGAVAEALGYGGSRNQDFEAVVKLASVTELLIGEGQQTLVSIAFFTYSCA